MFYVQTPQGDELTPQGLPDIVTALSAARALLVEGRYGRLRVVRITNGKTTDMAYLGYTGTPRRTKHTNYAVPPTTQIQ